MLTKQSLQEELSLDAENYARVVNYLCAGFALFVRSGFGEEYVLQLSLVVAPFLYEKENKKTVRLLQEYELVLDSKFSLDYIEDTNPITVNYGTFVKILFSVIALKHICHINNSRLGYGLPMLDFS